MGRANADPDPAVPGPSRPAKNQCTLRPVPTIVLNGDPRSIAAGRSVADLVAELGLLPAQVAVEKNREIVPRAAHAQTPLHDGDILEIVTFVGGG